MQAIKNIHWNSQTIITTVVIVCVTAILIVALAPLFQTAVWAKYGFAYIGLLSLLAYNLLRKK
jgi:hypothetical protein